MNERERMHDDDQLGPILIALFQGVLYREAGAFGRGGRFGLRRLTAACAGVQRQFGLPVRREHAGRRIRWRIHAPSPSSIAAACCA